MKLITSSSRDFDHCILAVEGGIPTFEEKQGEQAARRWVLFLRLRNGAISAAQTRKGSNDNITAFWGLA